MLKQKNNKELHAKDVFDLLESRTAKKHLLEKDENEFKSKKDFDAEYTWTGKLKKKVQDKVISSNKDQQKLSKDAQEIIDKYTVRYEKIIGFTETVIKVIKDSYSSSELKVSPEASSAQAGWAAATSGQGKKNEAKLFYENEKKKLRTNGGEKFLQFVSNLKQLASDCKSDSEFVEDSKSFKEFLSHRVYQGTFVVGTQFAYLLKNIGTAFKSKKVIVDTLENAESSVNLNDALGENSKIAEELVKSAFLEPIKVFQILTKEQLEDISGGLIEPPSTSQAFKVSLKSLDIDPDVIEGSFMTLPVGAIKIFYLTSKNDQKDTKSKNNHENNHEKIINKFLEKFESDIAKLEDFRNEILKLSSQYNSENWISTQIKNQNNAKFFIESLKQNIKSNKLKELKEDAYEAILALEKKLRFSL